MIKNNFIILSHEAEIALSRLLEQTEHGLFSIKISGLEYNKGAIYELKKNYIDTVECSASKEWAYQVTLLPSACTYFEDKSAYEKQCKKIRRQEWIKYCINTAIGLMTLIFTLAMFLRE